MQKRASKSSPLSFLKPTQSLSREHIGAMSSILYSGPRGSRREYKPDSRTLTRSLLNACHCGNLAEVKELVAAGADINVQDSSLQRTPLMIAAQHTHPSLIEYFLELNAQVNRVDAWGRSALMIACQMGHLECVKPLVFSWQSDIDKKDNDGNTALILTASYLDNGPDHLKCMKLLLEQDADVNIKNDMSMTACMHCVKRPINGWEGIQMLLDAGADPEVRNDVGENLLMQTASEGKAENLQRLLDLGIYDITLGNFFGDNALILALDTGNTECVERLLQAGSNPNSESCLGCYALSVAASNVNSFDNTLLLLKYGAVPRPARRYVRYDLFIDEDDDIRDALIYCTENFQPSDMAVMHKNFSTANLLSTVASCFPTYQVKKDYLSKLDCPHTKVVVDYIREAAKSCPDWVEISSDFTSEPSSLVFLSQQAVSKLAGFSKNRLEKLSNCGLPHKLVRSILHEGLEESMFALPVVGSKGDDNNR